MPRCPPSCQVWLAMGHEWRGGCFRNTVSHLALGTEALPGLQQVRVPVRLPQHCGAMRCHCEIAACLVRKQEPSPFLASNAAVNVTYVNETYVGTCGKELTGNLCMLPVPVPGPNMKARHGNALRSPFCSSSDLPGTRMPNPCAASYSFQIDPAWISPQPITYRCAQSERASLLHGNTW